MKNREISCEVCRDLYPLVRDGVASGESTELVRTHLAACPACAAACGEEGQPLQGGVQAMPDDGRVLRHLRGRFHIFGLCLLLLGVMAGVVLTGSQGMFYNFVLMPMAGALGYMLLRRRAYLVPGAVFLVSMLWLYIAFALEEGTPGGAVPGMALVYAGIYALLSLLGIVIGALLVYAFHKEEKHEEA